MDSALIRPGRVSGRSFDYELVLVVLVDGPVKDRGKVDLFILSTVFSVDAYLRVRARFPKRWGRVEWLIVGSLKVERE